MAKENKFTKVLQNRVEASVLRDIEIQQLESELKALEVLAIKTPEQVKREKVIREKLAELRVEEQGRKNAEEKVVNKQERKVIDQPEEFNIKAANYDQLLSRREEVKLALEEALASHIMAPEKIEKLLNELNELEKAIIALETIELTEEKEDKKTEQQEKTEIAEQQKNEQDLSDKEKEEKIAKEAELKQAYYDAMVKFYAIREANANKLGNSTDRLVNTNREYSQEIIAEDAMYKARDEYLKLGKSDPYTAEREALNEHAKKCEKQNRDILAQKTAKYRKLEIELARLQKARTEKEQDIDKAIKVGATPEIIAELKDDLNELDIKIKNTKQELAKVKENLSQAMEILENRRDLRRKLSLESREYDAQSAKEKANTSAARKVEAKSRNDVVQADKLSTSTIENEVQRNEKRYNDIKKQLKELKEKEPDNFEKRLALLEELYDASQQLKASKEVQKDIERGIELDTDEAIKQAEKDYKSKEEKKQDFIKDTKKLREAAEAKEKAEGERAVEDPIGIKRAAEKSEIEKIVGTAVAASVIAGQGDSGTKDAMTAAAVGTIVKENIPPAGAPCNIKELNNPDLYKTINTKKEGQEYIDTVAAIREANGIEEEIIDNGEQTQ